MRKPTWIIAGAAVAAGLMWHVARGDGAAGSAARSALPASPGATDADLRAELQSLRADVRELERERDRLGAVAGDDRVAGDRPEPAEPIRPLDPDEAARRTGAMIEAAVGELEAALDHEPVDPAWSGPQESALAAYFADNRTIGSTLRDAECRSSLCRIRLDHDDTDARHRLGALLGRGPLTGAHVFRPGEGGVGTVLYLARPGHDDRFHAAFAAAADRIAADG